MSTVTLVGNRWVDDRGNSWSNIVTQEQAEHNSKSLSYCSGCRDCSYCSGCSDCRGCSGCRDCRGCRGCRDCRDCRYCSGCRDCSESPQRLVSGRMGSRSAQTTAYWSAGKTWVVCGCFRGTLEEFSAKVEAVYPGDCQHGNDYRKFVATVRALIADTIVSQTSEALL